MPGSRPSSCLVPDEYAGSGEAGRSLRRRTALRREREAAWGGGLRRRRPQRLAGLVARRPVGGARPVCSHRTAGRSPCQRTANDTVDDADVGTPWSSKLAPSQRVGIPVGRRLLPSASRRSTSWTKRPTDAPRTISENGPVLGRAASPTRLASRAMSRVARRSPATTAM
jgi:hypothetical protein